MPRLLGRLVLVLACVATLATGRLTADENELRAALGGLQGEWTGEVQVKAMDGFVLKTFSAVVRGAWENNALVSELVIQDGPTDYVAKQRRVIRLGRLEASVERPAQPVDRYLGEIVGGALVWTNAEGNRRDARELVTERDGERLLETSSIEPIRALGLSGLVRLEGRFRQPAKAAARAPANGSAVATSGSPEAEAVVAGLRRDLEQERRAAAALHERLADAEQRLAALRSGADDAQKSVSTELEQTRARLAEAEREAAALGQRLRAAEGAASGTASDLSAAEAARRTAEERARALEETAASARSDREGLTARVAELERALDQARRDNEALLAAAATRGSEQQGAAERVRQLEARLAAAEEAARQAHEAALATPVPPVSETVASSVARAGPNEEVSQLERRLFTLETERNTAREQMVLAQSQLEETRRLRDETLMRFQAVVTELNAMREENERLARANVSLQAEVRAAQANARQVAEAGPAGDPARPVVGAAPATTLDGRTADMVIAGLQIIGVTQGEDEDKAILDGRLYRNGDLVEAQLGIVFVRIDGNALVFQDRRGREYRRRF